MTKNSDGQRTLFEENILYQGMEQIMHQSMMPYAEHVILERALPRVEDGLKPVQRRILYTMLELGLSPDKPYRKCARIVGDCLGKYHPHGDSSVYDAMVRLAQPFNMQMQLVDGHGNFGSVDGDPAAAMRYTEARMTPLAMELLKDIDKDTVKFSLNFDDTLKEPDTLPAAFPNLLVNGSSGIAVGLATNIPPHNLGEAADAVIAMLDDSAITLDKMMKFIPCPDFPTGGYLLESSEVRAAYETGRGRLVLRAKTHIEQQKNGKSLIVVTEMPYQVNKASALEKILQITQEKKSLFAGVSDIRDESDRTGMRAVIEVKKDADAEKILQYLFKYSDLQTTFGVNIVAIANGKPLQMGLLELVRHYIEYRREVVTRRTRFDLENAKRREHILEGLMIAIDNIDEVIALIRASKSPKIAREKLMERFKLTEVQAQAILDLRLQRLTNLELLSIETEYRDTQKLILELESILASETKLRKLIRGELKELKERYTVPRRTEFLAASAEISIAEDDLKAPEEECTVLLLEDARVRRIPKRLNGAELPDERVLWRFDTATGKRLRLFTDRGAALLINVEDIPETKATARPAGLSSLVTLEEGERIIAAFDDAALESGELYFYTAGGYVKRSSAQEYLSRTKRIAAHSLKEGDEVIGVSGFEGETILLISAHGMAIRFETDTVPVMGRVSAGVKCMKLEPGDRVVFARQTLDEGEIVLVTDRGYAKRCFVFDYDVQGRNGKGLKTFEFRKNGANGQRIAAAMYVREPYDFAVRQHHGTLMRFNTDQVLIEPRVSRGQLLVMALLDDVVVDAAKVF
ncbi:MAG: DNA topoisomerase (ATP-hydrolyzing) [Bacillota bacterium]